MKSEKQRECIKSISSLMDLSLTLQNINKTLEVKCGLSFVQWSLLKKLLNMPAVSPLFLAKALGVTPGTLTQTLIRLDRKKYLFMCDDPTDARKKMISITRLGKETLVKVDKEFEFVFSEINIIDSDVEHIHHYLNDKVKSRLKPKKEDGEDELENFELELPDKML